jgi:hypothetical protein
MTCLLCGRPRATSAQWGHATECTCPGCISVCFNDCARKPRPPLPTLDEAELARGTVSGAVDAKEDG